MRPVHTVEQVRQTIAGDHSRAVRLVREAWDKARLARSGAHPDPAWIHVADAAQIDAQLAALEALDPGQCALYGVPFAVKDNIDVAGWPTTAACPSFAYLPTRSAAAVSRLQAAGAVLIGKTNLDQFATGLVGTRSPYGVVPNTFSRAHVCGGSSSGSASVVARGFVSFSLGTDTAGSGRIPAGFNNLVGFKPTPGTISTEGVVPAVGSIDCVSVFALNAADAHRIATVLRDRPDSSGRFASGALVPRYAFGDRLRVGVPAEPVFTSDSYRPLFVEALSCISALGATLGKVAMHDMDEVARLLYDGPWVAERLVAAGASITGGAPDIDPSVAAVIGAGTGYSALDVFVAQRALRELAQRLESIWSDHDVLMVPTAPGLPTIAQVLAEPIARNSELGVYTNFVNLLGWAAVAVPSGFDSDGLPFGITFIGPGGSDEALLALADRWQRTRALPLGAGLQDFDGGRPPDSPSLLESVPLAVVGAHLAGMPLHHQVVQAGARLRARTRTSPHYRLYALDATIPPKPGLVRQNDGGGAIELEVYDFPLASLGTFVAQVPPPLGIGSLELENGQWVKGFICEQHALTSAQDITAFGGWRSFVATHRSQS